MGASKRMTPVNSPTKTIGLPGQSRSGAAIAGCIL